MSPTPSLYKSFVEEISQMWASQPHWTAKDLGAIRVHTWIVDADHDEALVTSRIWTEPKHIEARLADLSEHMENVIQKYLRNEFESIEAYNRDAGEIAVGHVSLWKSLPAHR